MIQVYAGVGLALLLAVGVQTYRVSSLKTELAEQSAEIAKEREAASNASREAERRFREIERKTADEQDRARDEAVKERRQLEADLSASRDNSQRLLRQLSKAGRGPGAASNSATPSGGSATRVNPGVFPDVFGECVQRVQRLAEAADASRGAGSLCERTYDALTGGGR